MQQRVKGHLGHNVPYAHDELSRALKNDRRQTQSVVTSVRTFVGKAKVVREAYKD